MRTGREGALRPRSIRDINHTRYRIGCERGWMSARQTRVDTTTIDRTQAGTTLVPEECERMLAMLAGWSGSDLAASQTATHADEWQRERPRWNTTRLRCECHPPTLAIRICPASATDLLLRHHACPGLPRWNPKDWGTVPAMMLRWVGPTRARRAEACRSLVLRTAATHLHPTVLLSCTTILALRLRRRTAIHQ